MAAERDMSELNAALGGLRESAGKRGPSQATRLVELVTETAVELWHDADGEAWATIEEDDHYEHWSLGSRGFRRWATRVYYESEDTTPSGTAVKDALSVLEGKAIHAGPQHCVYVRVAEVEGATYIDLCDPGWRAVRLTGGGWTLAERPPVRFQRRRGNLPLPAPCRGGDLNALRGFLNLPEDENWRLFVACLVSALRPRGPYVVTNMRGEQGSGKTTSGRIFRRLIDPNTAALRSQPRDERDMAIAARNGWVVAYDNLSYLPDWLSDGLCRMATGGGFGTRELYTNDEEALFDYMRPVLLNGIDGVVTRGDLRDREVTIDHPVIPKANRRSERELWDRFDAAAPAMFGAVLDAYCAALRKLPAVKLAELPRMADFAMFGVALERALRWPDGSFMRAYDANRAAATSLALDDSLVAMLVRKLADSGGFEGTATVLLAKLEDLIAEPDRERVRRSSAWPKGPRSLSGLLRRLAPDLRTQGWAEVEPPTNNHQKVWRILRPAASPRPAEYDDAAAGDANRGAQGRKSSLGDANATADDAGSEYQRDAGTQRDAESAVSSPPCPECRSAATRRDADLTASGHGYRCDACGARFVDPRPAAEWGRPA